MIKLSRMSDYAVVVLEALSRQGDGSMSASQIAAGAGLPEPTVAKVLKLMAAGGVVVSQRGASGGYALARDPADVTVFDIVTSIEGRLGLTACVEGGGESCALESHCSMSGRWDIVNRAVRVAFEGLSLADMIGADRRAA